MTKSNEDPKIPKPIVPPWLTLASSFLGFLEKFLSAFLIAWSNHLRQQNRKLAVELEKTKLEKDVMEHKHEADKNASKKSDRNIIDSFLSGGQG